jgi:hypothetical protein
MSETKHTPGPWTVGEKFTSFTKYKTTPIHWRKPEKICGECGETTGGSDYLVAWTFDSSCPGLAATARANACLIAAAPELLAACKLIWEQWCGHEQINDPDWEGYATLQAVSAAITKAEPSQLAERERG